jgi:hypothetical protein
MARDDSERQSFNDEGVHTVKAAIHSELSGPEGTAGVDFFLLVHCCRQAMAAEGWDASVAIGNVAA